jgi:hypothetical protein
VNSLISDDPFGDPKQQEFNMTTHPSSVRSLALAAVLTAVCSAAALAASPEDLAAAKARYNQDMADCSSGRTSQDLATCRLEARNSLADAPRARPSESLEQYKQNALQRCEVHRGDDRVDCEARIIDLGNASGSVDSGGILRTSVRVVPAN